LEAAKWMKGPLFEGRLIGMQLLEIKVGHGRMSDEQKKPLARLVEQAKEVQRQAEDLLGRPIEVDAWLVPVEPAGGAAREGASEVAQALGARWDGRGPLQRNAYIPPCSVHGA